MDINIQVVPDKDWDRVYYSGPINEDAEIILAPLVEKLSGNCIFNFRSLAYVNSCGVRAWINFMREVEKGRRVVFEECTPELVMQINMIPSFKASAQIKSVYAVYVCESCEHRQNELFETGRNMPDGSAPVPEISCGKCGGHMEMEELEDEFFAFAQAS